MAYYRFAWGIDIGNRALKAIKLVRDQEGDEGTAEMLEHMLVSEEKHVDWLETQLETIRQIGIENYLTQQLSQ